MFSWLNRFQPLGALVLRLVLGVLMTVFGYQKVIPHGSLYRFVHLVGHLGIPVWLGYVAAFTEFFGGILLIVGLLTRVVAVLMVIDMVVAILKVTLHRGLMGNSPLPLGLCCLAIALMLVFSGAGWLALDDLVGKGTRSPAKAR